MVGLEKLENCATLKIPVDCIMVYDFYLPKGTVMTLCYALRSGKPTVTLSFATTPLGVIYIMPCMIIFLFGIFLLPSSKTKVFMALPPPYCQPLRYFALPFLTLRVGAYFAGTSKLVGDLHLVLLHISQISSSKYPPYLPTTTFPQLFRDIFPCTIHLILHDLLSFITIILLCLSL